jgi:hypothetical protein
MQNQSLAQVQKTSLLLDFFPQRAEVARRYMSHTRLIALTSETARVIPPRKSRWHVECDCACK